MAVQMQPQQEEINRAEFDVLRAKAFSAWHLGPTATYMAWFEDAFQEGWIRLDKALASGREIPSWEGYIVESGRNYLLRMHDKGRRTTSLADDDATLVDSGAAERFEAVDDHAERLYQAKVVRRVLAEEFDERERQLIKLKYELQRDDREIAELMNVSPRTVKRLFSGRREKGQLGLNQRLAQYIGPAPDEALLCRSRRSQVKALVGGWTMSNARKAQVHAHLQTCEGCRTFTRRALGYQMLLPPVALPVALAGNSSGADTLTQMAHVLHHTVDKVDYDHATAIAAAADAGSSGAVADSGGGGGAFAERASALKQHLTDAFATGQQQAVALHARVTGVDPSALPAMRPGAAAATVASCLALGGGAYCAVEGLPNQLGAPLGLERQAKADGEAKAKAPEPPKTPTAPATPAPADPPPSAAPTPDPPAPAAPTTPAAAPAPTTSPSEQEFGIEPPSAPPAAPAPAPPSGGTGQFGIE